MGNRKPSLRAGFDELLAQANRRALPEDSYDRLLQRLASKQPRHQPRRWALLLTSMAFASAVAFAFLHLGRRTMAGPFEVAASSPDFAWQVTAADGAWQAISGYGLLVLRETRMRIGTHAGSRLRLESQGIRVLAGTADFDVEPRTTGVPVRVLVSHGAIEVIGTELWVEQRERGGKVLLKRGHIRFVPDSGEPRDLAAGQELSWPLPELAVVAPPPKSEPGPHRGDQAGDSTWKRPARRRRTSRA